MSSLSTTPQCAPYRNSANHYGALNSFGGYSSAGGPSLPQDYRVRFGQLTFDAERYEGPGAYFSRAIHYPGGSNSGVTIGAGYDMGLRTPLQIQRELRHAGISDADAVWLSTAAGLRGSAAETFVRQNRQQSPVISSAAQKRLFEEIVTPEIVCDVRRILTKPDVVARYGAIAWNELHPGVQELLFDLRYRGDYTPGIRERIQPLVVANDLVGLRGVLEDASVWSQRGVTEHRMNTRIAIIDRHLQHQMAPASLNGAWGEPTPAEYTRCRAYAQ